MAMYETKKKGKGKLGSQNFKRKINEDIRERNKNVFKSICVIEIECYINQKCSVSISES